jgi:two-component system chemotaxis response regulator CheY
MVQPSVSRQPSLGAVEHAARSRHVLVVEDEAGVRRLLADLLTSEGYLVSEASNGLRGLDRLRDERPDIVILDLMMPVMSGFAFAEACRRMDGYQEVPIIAMSAMYDLKRVEATLHALGVGACLAKPFDLDVLLSLVAKL